MQIKHLLSAYVVVTILFVPYVHFMYDWEIVPIVGGLFILALVFVALCSEMPKIEEKPRKKVKPRMVNQEDFAKKKKQLIKAKNSKQEKQREAEVIEAFQATEWTIGKSLAKPVH